MLSHQFYKVWLKILLFIFYFQCTFCWDFKCLYKTCSEKENDSYGIRNLYKYNPLCLIFECNQEMVSEDIGSNSKFSWNCWFQDCSKKPKGENAKFWKYDFWFSNNEGSESWKQKLYCIFKDCQGDEKETKKENINSKFSFQSLYGSLKQYFNALKPKEFVAVNDFDKNQKFSNYDFWHNKNIGYQSWKQKLYCIFKDCPRDEKEENSESGYSFYGSLKNYLNTAKSEKFTTKNIFSELNPYCWLIECCNDNNFPGDIEKLQNLLETRVYGQHLTNVLIDAIKYHWNGQHMSKKALVLSFHGLPGTGKNYVSGIIVESLLKLGLESKYAHLLNGGKDFTLQGNSESYRQIYSWLKGNVTICGKQIFIFDGADQMRPEVLNSILPLADYRAIVDGVDYRNTIFIFLSNLGSASILSKLDDIYSHNKTRQDVQVADFEGVIKEEVLNKPGGLYQSDIIRHNLIDHYIPFLPLERHHVKECILDKFRERNVDLPSKKHVSIILNSLSWKQANNYEYSLSGCKQIEKKFYNLYEKYYKTKDEKIDL